MPLDPTPMPLVETSSFRPAPWLPGGHLQTIVPSLQRRPVPLTTEGERLELEDGDFLDLEWKQRGRSKLAILCHGLEGSARAGYIQRMAGALDAGGWDLLAWNYRGCSGELNRLPRFYHSGATEDLSAVVAHALREHPARRIDLVGFSLGGNMILKYLGEQGDRLPPRVAGAVTFSVPCDLACSSRALDTAFNREVYMRRFIKTLAEKVRRKAEVFPDVFDLRGLERIRTFREFDDHFTAPLHGFKSAQDYWDLSSANRYLEGVRVPALLVNARNDPFLGPRCFPLLQAEGHDCFVFEEAASGGHVGFVAADDGFWMGRRAVDFLNGIG